MKRSMYLKQLLVLLFVKILFSACDPDLPTAPDSKGPGGNVGPDPIYPVAEYYSEETFEYEFAADQKTRFTLDGINGNVYVEQSKDKTTFNITVTKRVDSFSKEDADEYLQKLDVVFENYAEELRVTTIHPYENGQRNYSVEYWITLPKNVDLEINTTNSDVTLKEVVGSVNVEVTNGKIKAQVETPPFGELTLKNVNGDMRVNIPETTSAEFFVQSYNGKVETHDLSISNTEKNKNSISGLLGNGEGVVDIKSTNGDIEVVGF